MQDCVRAPSSCEGYLTYGQLIKILPSNGFKNMFVQPPILSRLCSSLNCAAITDFVCNISVKSEWVNQFFDICLDYLVVISPR